MNDNNLFKFEELEDCIFHNEPIKSEYDFNIPHINQYNTNLCWFSSLSSFFLYKYYNKGHCKKINLSIAYVLFWLYIEKFHMLFNIVDRYRNDKPDIIFDFINRGIDETGNWHDFKNIVKNYGVVRKKDMKETVHSKNPEHINMFLTRYARIQLLKYYKKKSKQVKDETISRVYNFLTHCLGNPPNHISLSSNKKISPLEFGGEIFPGLEDYEQVISIESSAFKYKGCYKDPFDRKIINVSFNDFKNLITNQKNVENLVVIGVDCRYGIDYKNQIFTYKPNRYKDVFGLSVMPSRDDGFDTNALKINHNLILIDEKLINGSKYKICYDNFFSKCICYMEDEWFNNYVFEAIINKEHLKCIKYDNKELLKINSNF